MSEGSINQLLQNAIEHHQAGRLAEAEQGYRRILAQHPDHADALHLLGMIAYQAGHKDQAIELIQKAIRRNPNCPAYYLALADVCRVVGKWDQAIAAYRTAIKLKPDDAKAYNNLGNALSIQGRLDQAIAAYRVAIELNPNLPETHNNLGNILSMQWQFDQAIASFHQAIQLKPDYAEALSNLGIAQLIQGQLDQAIASFGAAIRLKPDYAEAHSRLVFTTLFHPDYDAASIAAEARRWNDQHAEPLRHLHRPHGNDRSPNRPLRIGYVSPDFYHQAESFFVVPLLESHDRGQFEIHCYASVARPDATTQRLRRCAVWHDVLRWPDELLAQQIRKDGIDILVDLSMHMADNRLLVFARKPAPVQVSWLAYPGTTGLKAIDYRLTDSYLDPNAGDEAHYAERSVRLPDLWVCYAPLIDLPSAATQPSQETGTICFGSLNNPCKINGPLLQLWAQVLLAVPDSKLLLLTASQTHRDHIRSVMTNTGIDPGRIDFAGRCSRREYLRLFNRLDICLDTLPYNGITTTCDALWMGVPVVTLTGQTSAGRAGDGILSTIGLADLVARTPGQFVQVAAQLASDSARRADLRSTLRKQMQSSPVMDAPRFARNVEAAYRQMWRSWCSGELKTV